MRSGGGGRQGRGLPLSHGGWAGTGKHSRAEVRVSGSQVAVVLTEQDIWNLGRGDLCVGEVLRDPKGFRIRRTAGTGQPGGGADHG